MEIERKAQILRTARAWLGEEQKAAAEAAGLAWNTLIAAEKGRSCTDKTWDRMSEHYRSRGISFVEQDDLTLIIIRSEG